MSRAGSERGRAVILAWVVTVVIIAALHWWQGSLDEDQAWLWSCHTMGNRDCAPGQPVVKIQIGGSD